MNEIKVLLICKGNLDCGNYITISRIKKYIEQVNQSIQIEVFGLFDGNDQEKEFLKCYERFLPDVVIGLNLIRCEFLSKIKKNYKLILILGGTDINMDINSAILPDSTRLLSMCHGIVAFSNEMKIQFSKIYSNMMPLERFNINVIPQGIDVPYKCNTFDHFDALNSIGAIDLSMSFVVIGRLRPVKDPDFIVKPFIDWCSLQTPNKYSLLYIGDVEVESNEILEFLDKIKSYDNIYHVNSITQKDVFKLMYRAKALINCSKNEGQCTTILEAMIIGLPVLARNVPGNQTLIKDDQTGILFSSEEDFKNALTRVTMQDVANVLIKNARVYVTENHNPTSEANSYIKIIQQIIV